MGSLGPGNQPLSTEAPSVHFPYAVQARMLIVRTSSLDLRFSCSREFGVVPTREARI